MPARRQCTLARKSLRSGLRWLLMSQRWWLFGDVEDPEHRIELYEKDQRIVSEWDASRCSTCKDPLQLKQERDLLEQKHFVGTVKNTFS